MRGAGTGRWEKNGLARHTEAYGKLLKRVWPEYELDLTKLAKNPESLTELERACFSSLGRDNLHFFMTMVLGYYRLSGPGGVHGDLCRAIAHPTKPLMVLLWREGFKSTHCAVGKPLWGAVNDPVNFDGVTTTPDKDLGEGWMGAINRHVTQNPRFRALYPEIEPGKPWSTTQMRLAQRKGEREMATFTFRTWGQPLTGRHTSYLDIDDLTNDVNWVNRREQEAMFTKLQGSWATLNTDELILSATPYTDYDVVARVMAEYVPEVMDTFLVPVRGKTWIDDTGALRWVDGPYNLPDEWDDARLKSKFDKLKQRKLQHSQYFLDLSIPGEGDFKREWIRYTMEHDAPDMTVYMAVDGASGRGKSKMAVGAVGIDAEGKLYVRETHSAFKTEKQLVDKVFEMVQRLNPSIVGVEKYGAGGHTLIEKLQDEMVVRGIYFYLEPVTATTLAMTANKEQRIRETLWLPYQNGAVYHFAQVRGTEIEHELIGFPHTMFLDEVDMLSYAMMLAMRGKYRGMVDSDGPKPTRPYLTVGDKRGYSLVELTRERGFEELEELVVGGPSPL